MYIPSWVMFNLSLYLLPLLMIPIVARILYSIYKKDWLDVKEQSIIMSGLLFLLLFMIVLYIFIPSLFTKQDIDCEYCLIRMVIS